MKLILRYGNKFVLERNYSKATAFENSKIELIYTTPKGGQISHITNLDNFGNFTDEYRLNMTGKWFVEAKFNGSPYFSPSTSNIAAISVGYRFPEFFVLGLLSLFLFLSVPYALQRWNKLKVKNITEQNCEEKVES